MIRPAHWRFTAANTPNDLRAASDELDTILGAFAASERTRFAARLVCEEIVLNALEHGGARWVTMELTPTKDPRVLVFEDDGVSFDPMTRAAAQESSTSQHIGTRGRGLILLRGMSTSVQHHREDGRNRITVLLIE